MKKLAYLNEETLAMTGLHGDSSALKPAEQKRKKIGLAFILLVAVDKKTGSNQVLFEGKKSLTLERSGKIWQILVFR